jgi:hypothetical protein
VARIFAILPERSSPQIDEMLSAARILTEERDWPLSVRRTKRVRVVGEGWERGVQLLSPTDASGLYRQIHRTPTLVLTFATVMVRRDPSRDPPVRRAALRLEQFVAYKAFFCLLRGHGDLARTVSGFDAWREAVHCDGEDDPRVLPLHTFALGPRQPDLDTAEGARIFRAQHGNASARTDDQGVLWGRAEHGARHGGGALTVAGRTLPNGFHWDVSRRRGSVRLLTAGEVWKLSGRHAYVNVYPDAHVRAPGMRQVRRVWSPSQDK